MRLKNLVCLTLTSLGIALLLAGLFFDNGDASRAFQAATPTPIMSLDRLAEPTLPADPTQADLGASVYWLDCMTCHGDRGQGLTEEFRQLVGPEEQNCWQVGCHGPQPYENGFRLPTAVPALIGAQTLAKFSSGAQLQSYIRVAMPYWKPGSLTDEDSWKVTAFLLRANGLWDASTELGPDNASQVKIQRSGPTSVPTPTGQDSQSGASPWWWIGFAFAAVVILFLLLRSRNSNQESSP